MIGSKFSILPMEAKTNKPTQLAYFKSSYLSDKKYTFSEKSQTKWIRDLDESEVQENFDF